jgi:glycogen debranching enzyme-like protein
VLTILEGSTFCISDDRGDIAEETSGFFAHDTRFLSRLVLHVGGTKPLLLSSGRVEHFQQTASSRVTRSRSRASASSGRVCRNG